jgi:hypothetical protein
LPLSFANRVACPHRLARSDGLGQPESKCESFCKSSGDRNTIEKSITD